MHPISSSTTRSSGTRGRCAASRSALIVSVHVGSADGNMMRRLRLARTAISLLVAPCAAYAQGIVPPGAGPITRAFGGTAVGIAQDVVGSLYWNPATLSF